MGCDYVIIKYLLIEGIHNIKVKKTINIEYKYYDWDPSDTEDTNFEKEWEEYTQIMLSPLNKELIYENGIWFNTEYISILPEEVCFKDIIRITLIEKRKSAMDFYHPKK